MQLRSLALAFALAFTGTAQAQFEDLETIAPTSYASFPAFNTGTQMGAFSRMGLGGLLLVGSAPLIPASTGVQAMFGRGVDVQFRILEPRKQFFARFRSMPYITTPPTAVRVRFFLTSGVWTPFIAFPITNTYSNALVNVGGTFGQAYRAVQMVGNGSLPGYVGMDTFFLF